MTDCPCQSGLDLAACCGPYLDGSKKPATAVALMRSRYVAFTKGEIDYIEQTHDPETRKEFGRKEAQEWSEKADWQGFELLRSEDGEEGDTRGIVEFVVRYKIEAHEIDHHEISEFRKEGDTWYFRDGKEVPITVRRDQPKIGRNDPCSCGSGKKYKKCCGRG